MSLQIRLAKVALAWSITGGRPDIAVHLRNMIEYAEKLEESIIDWTNREQKAVLRAEELEKRIEAVLERHKPQSFFSTVRQETITICGECQEITGGEPCTTERLLRGENE